MTAVSLFGNKTFFELGTSAWNDTGSNSELEFLNYDKLCSLVPFSRLEPLDVGQSNDGPAAKEKFPACNIFARDQIDDLTLRDRLSRWLHGFNKTDQVTKAMTAGVFLANKASLTLNQWRDRNNAYYPESTGRNIYTAPGVTVNKPDVSTANIIVLSILLFIELLALGVLTWLIYRKPSESRSLDALTFLSLKERIGDPDGR